MVIAENSQGLDNDQLDQLRQLAHIKVQNYEEASLVKRQQANNPCIENEYNGPAFLKIFVHLSDFRILRLVHRLNILRLAAW